MRPRLKRWTSLLAVFVLAATACTRQMPGPPPPPTTVAPTNTHTATQASPITTSAPPKTVDLQPGPHSAIADIDLPAGTVPLRTDSQDEDWRYTTPYPDTVTFLQTRFATGRRYDSYGATWWNGLPPCYNDSKYDPAQPAHESPPKGWVIDDGTQWFWSDSAMTLCVEVWRPGIKTVGGDIKPYGEIDIFIWPAAQIRITCNRA
jgi:hypothetical protein